MSCTGLRDDYQQVAWIGNPVVVIPVSTQRADAAHIVPQDRAVQRPVIGIKENSAVHLTGEANGLDTRKRVAGYVSRSADSAMPVARHEFSGSCSDHRGLGLNMSNG